MKKNLLLILILGSFFLNERASAQESIGVYYRQALDANGFAYLWANNSYGLRGTFRINENFALLSSIGYEKSTYDFTELKFNYIRLYDMEAPRLDFAEVKLISTSFHFRFDMLNQKERPFYLFFGPTINTCLHQMSISVLYGEEQIENKYRYLYNTHLSAGIGTERKIGRHLILDLNTVLQSPIWTNPNGALKLYTVRLSVNAGLSYKIKNND